MAAAARLTASLAATGFGLCVCDPRCCCMACGIGDVQLGSMAPSRLLEVHPTQHLPHSCVPDAKKDSAVEGHNRYPPAAAAPRRLASPPRVVCPLRIARVPPGPKPKGMPMG